MARSPKAADDAPFWSPRSTVDRVATVGPNPADGICAIVPAYNEVVSVASVVQTLLASSCFDEVVVVDDGSTDGTAAAASGAGARVVSTPRNLGKGGALLYAYGQVPQCGRVAFFDADLTGLRPHHVQSLAAASDRGYDQVAGLRDKGRIQNFLQVLYSPLITGERVLRRWVLDALPVSCWKGYCIETAINDVVARGGGTTALMVLPGVAMRTKSDKVGLVRGVRGHLQMTAQIVKTRRALASSEGMTCEF